LQTGQAPIVVDLEVELLATETIEEEVSEEVEEVEVAEEPD
jgi:hypothetical protein